MRHRVAHRKLGRVTPHRIALLRNLATALFEHERIRTTLMKAKELRPYAEKLITLAKRDDDRLHARRLVLRDIHDPTVVKKLFDTLGARFATRAGRLHPHPPARDRARATARRWPSSSCSAPSTSRRTRPRRGPQGREGQGRRRRQEDRRRRQEEGEGRPREKGGPRSAQKAKAGRRARRSSCRESYVARDYCRVGPYGAEAASPP